MLTYISILLALLFTATIATQVAAWQAGSDGLLCTLTHEENGAEVLLTYDPSGPVYSLTVTTPDPWFDHPTFGIAFLGGQALTITTDSQTLSDDTRSLTVTDSGFGNVLDGLAQNQTAIMVAGPSIVELSLEGAAPEVEIFRNCGSRPAV